MKEAALFFETEPRTIIGTLIEKRVPGIVSYQSKGKWHVAKVVLAGLGACRLEADVIPPEKPHPLNIQFDQPVGVSLKYAYGKFIFESKVVGLEPSEAGHGGGKMILAVPDRIQVVQRRSYFRVEVPGSLKVTVLLWPRLQREVQDQGPDNDASAGRANKGPSRYWQGKLVDISAGGAQVAIDSAEARDIRCGQFLGVRFTPLPYELPLVFNAQVRNILPTADCRNMCLGLQIVGLEASCEGMETLSRLVAVVEHYYQMNESGARRMDFHTSSGGQLQRT